MGEDGHHVRALAAMNAEFSRGMRGSAGDPGLPLLSVHAATRGTPGPSPGGDVTTAGYRLACGRSIGLLCSL